MRTDVRQCGPMSMRRSGRPSQVRPRPPSTGRPAPIPVRPRAVGSGRVTRHRPIQRSPGLPLPAKILLVTAVAALAATVVFAGQGGIARLAAALGSAVSGVVEDITATPTPRPTQVVVADAPGLDAPAESYTNQATVDLSGTVPIAFAGRSEYIIRLYVALKDQEPAAIREAPLPPTPRFTLVGVELTKGANEFYATLVGPGGESEPSPVIRYVLDTSKPKITLTSPKDGSKVNGGTVTIAGRTQSRSLVVGRNESNGSSATAQADTPDGNFTLDLPIEPGTNGITITATDPAGNVTSSVISIRRGSGKLTVDLSASAFRFRISKLPDPITMTAVVTDPDGRPLGEARVTFTLSVPGLPAVTSETATDGTGSAVFQTTVPKGATEGTGLATVLVDAGALGTATDRTVLTVLE